MKKNTFILLSALFLLGCRDEYTEIGTKDFNKVPVLNSSSNFQGYFYHGNDEDYHYFSSRWAYEADKKYKVSNKDSLTVSLLKNPPVASGLVTSDFKMIRLSFLINGDASLLYFIFDEEEALQQMAEEKPQEDILPSTVRVFKTREELQAHLHEKQMEAIRSGKPPLPVPLTREMDDMLVEEGILPSQ